MLKHSLISNKFYVYANTIVKLKKINKTSNKLFIQKLSNGEQVVLPYMQSDLLLKRVYTVGEISKIVQKRSDTIRKYEKKGLIPTAKKFGDEYAGYSSWRYYTEEEVYQMVEFFSERVPGRPNVKMNNAVDKRIKNLSQKVKLTFKE